MKKLFVLLLLVGLAAAGIGYGALRLTADPTASFRTTTVKRGDLLSSISATGTVEAEEFVDVGTQVVGRIKELGPDPSDPEPDVKKKKRIDYGSIVHEGTVLANIDDAVYAAQVDQAKAMLARSQADLLQFKAHLDQCKQEYERAESLLPKKAIAGTDYDLVVANYKAAQANVGVGEAVIKQSEAALRLAQTNLDYTVIKSPVEGVIIDRRVNVGQTVVSSLNAPSLFLIAKDLRRMQVWASVNEADIGRILPDVPVQFTVDAYSGEVFQGKVTQVRLNATMTQNVVTYTVVITTDNSNLKLKPYLTANLKFVLENRPNVLLVPNMALRYKPRREQMAARSDRPAPSAPSPGGSERKASAGAKGQGGSAAEANHRGQVWVEDNGYARPVNVHTGLSDGTNTEISGDEVQEGLAVIIGEAKPDQAKTDDATNPFAPPKFFNKGGGRPKKSE